jgi:4-hydroxy-2-oxoheptanedioate aldolase
MSLKQLSFRDIVHSGRLVLGTFVALPAPEVVEIIGQVGFDFVAVDDEHAWMNRETQSSLIIAARSVGMGAIVRLGGNDPKLIGRMLDMGADGVVVPHVDTAEDARRAVRAAKFYPEGERGVSHRTRSAGYCVTDYQAYTAEANARTCVGVLIESKEAVENLNEILAVAGLDFVLVGHKDLSQSLGYPAQTEHPVVRKSISTVIRMARQVGLTPAVGVSRVDQARPFIDLGARMVLVSKDMGVLYRVYREVLAEAHQLG